MFKTSQNTEQHGNWKFMFEGCSIILRWQIALLLLNGIILYDLFRKKKLFFCGFQFKLFGHCDVFQINDIYQFLHKVVYWNIIQMQVCSTIPRTHLIVYSIKKITPFICAKFRVNPSPCPWLIHAVWLLERF